MSKTKVSLLANYVSRWGVLKYGESYLIIPEDEDNVTVLDPETKEIIAMEEDIHDFELKERYDIILKLDNVDSNYLYLQFRVDSEVSEDCDCYIDYTIFDSDYNEVDGGQMDYSLKNTYYQNIICAVKDIIEFAFDSDINIKYEVTTLDIEDLEN